MDTEQTTNQLNKVPERGCNEQKQTINNHILNKLHAEIIEIGTSLPAILNNRVVCERMDIHFKNALKIIESLLNGEEQARDNSEGQENQPQSAPNSELGYKSSRDPVTGYLIIGKTSAGTILLDDAPTIRIDFTNFAEFADVIKNIDGVNSVKHTKNAKG